MDMESYLSAALIPLLMAAVLIYYAIRLLVLHDISSILTMDRNRKLKNKEMYAKEAGKLMLFLAASSLAMAVILYWNTIAAVAEVCICILIFCFLWKKMDDKYGG